MVRNVHLAEPGGQLRAEKSTIDYLPFLCRELAFDIH